MHKGSAYPWLGDLWAVETTWWPYWAPKKFYFNFTQPQALAEWSFITITEQVSDEGIVDTSRKSVRYNLAGETGVWSGRFFLFNQFTGPPAETRFNLLIDRPSIPPVGNRENLPTYSGPLEVSSWQFSDLIPPWYDGTPMLGGCRPATWSEV